jgi:hypothetical protein
MENALPVPKNTNSNAPKVDIVFVESFNNGSPMRANAFKPQKSFS